MTTLNSSLYEFTEGGYSTTDPGEYVIEFKPIENYDLATVSMVSEPTDEMSLIAAAGPTYDGTIECGTLIVNNVIDCKESLIGNSASFKYTHSDFTSTNTLEVSSGVNVMYGASFNMGYGQFVVNGIDISGNLCQLNSLVDRMCYLESEVNRLSDMLYAQMK